MGLQINSNSQKENGNKDLK